MNVWADKLLTSEAEMVSPCPKICRLGPEELPTEQRAAVGTMSQRQALQVLQEYQAARPSLCRLAELGIRLQSIEALQNTRCNKKALLLCFEQMERLNHK